MANIIVTGATGFIGSHLCNRLTELGHVVYAVSRFNEGINGFDWHNRLKYNSNLKIITSNLNQSERLFYELCRSKAGIFYHLAWNGVGKYDRNDQYLQYNNITNTLNTLIVAKTIGCKKWIGMGSHAEYGEKCINMIRGIKEDDTTTPTTEYGRAKLATYNLIENMSKQMDINTCWVRLFNAYGEKDNPDWFLMYLIKELLKGKEPELTLGEQIWDYIYIDDVIDALIKIGFSDNTTGIYNLGSGETKSIKEYAEIVRDIINPTLKLRFGEIPYRYDQVMYLKANIDKLKKETNWKPKVSFNEGITKVINWYKENMDCYNNML